MGVYRVCRVQGIHNGYTYVYKVYYRDYRADPREQ